MDRTPNPDDLQSLNKELRFRLRQQTMELEDIKRELIHEVAARKSAETRARSLEEEFMTLFDHANDNITYTTLDGTIIETNNRASDIFGYKPEEVNGKHFSQFGVFSPGEMERSAEALADIVAGRPAPMMELETIRKDGATVFIEVNSKLVTKDNEKKGILSVIRDITDRRKLEEELARYRENLEKLVDERTVELREVNKRLNEEIQERKKIDQELRESEQKFRMIFENANDGIAYVGDDGIILDVNERMEEILGRKRHDVVGRNFVELGLFPPEEAEKQTEYFQALLAGKLTRMLDLHVLRRDGTTVPIEVNFRLIKKGSKKTRVLSIVRDITERKETEKALRQREEYFRVLTENASDITAILEGDGTIRYLSPSGKPVLGYNNPQGSSGRSGFDFLHPDDLHDLLDAFTDITETPGLKPPTEIRVRHEDGTWRTLEVTSTNLLDNPAVAGIVINSRDITERKSTEIELRRYRERLEDLVRERTTELEDANKQLRVEIEEHKRTEKALRESKRRLQFLSSRLFQAQESERRRLSIELHDQMGQDLALLKHRLRSVERSLRKDQASVRVSCQETSLYIDEIIENVRRLSRDLSPSMLEDVGLSAALRWLAEEFEKQHSVRISLDMVNIDSLFSREAQINIYRISQELLTNIGKHAQASRANFVISRDDNRVCLLIEDNGDGFDLEGLSKRGLEGRGMGLAALNERAQMLQADLDIQSQPGEGCRTSITIPI
jgi:PAS domain S-box-containing protein